jgi:hypothetical protein
MKHIRLALLVSVVSLWLAGCQRVYTTASNMDPLSQVPVSVQEKGDISLEASYELFDAVNSYGFDYSLGQSVFYNHLAVEGLNFLGHYALSDELSIGLGYKFNKSSPYKSHLISPSVNLYKNYPTKRGRATYGFDVLAGFQFKTAQNFMAVDEILTDYYFIYEEIPFEDSVFIIPGVVYDVETYPLGYYSIRQKQMRYFVQPSFSVEHKIVEFHLGGSFGIAHQFEYASSLDNLFVDFIQSEDISNPLVYYNRQRSFLMREVFMAFGLGPEHCKLMVRQGFGWSSDRYQRENYFLGIGLKSDFNIRKKSEDANPVSFGMKTY